MMTKNSNTVVKYMKRANIYKNSTGSFTFNPETFEARSYNWWVFVAKVEGKVIFNNYRYSVSTSRHQRLMKNLLNELGIAIDIQVELPRGIETSSLETLFETAEETLCDKFLSDELKKQERNAKAKAKRDAYKLTKEYHDNKFIGKASKLIQEERV